MNNHELDMYQIIRDCLNLELMLSVQYFQLIIFNK